MPEASAPPQGARFPLGWGAAALFLALDVFVWSAEPALVQAIPHADNIEQLGWAHSLQWGYVKHPPLPTWIVHAAVAWLGPSAWLTYLLAMLCAGLALALLWRAARLVLDEPGAFLVLLLSSLDYYVMGRGSFLNHNTVMLPFIAASAWAVLRIVRGAPWTVWLALGLVQALGMLTKYQMAIVVAANCAALLSARVWRQERFSRHALVCTAATLVPLLPHLAWLKDHDYSTFGYAGVSLLAGLPPGARFLHAGGFLVQQIGRLAPAIVAIGLLWMLRARVGAPATESLPDQRGIDPGALRALSILAWTPLAIIVALTLLAGVAPQNHWGASATLLLPFHALARWPELRRIALPRACAITVALHGLALCWIAVAAREAPAFHDRFAAQPLAALALAHWQRNTDGPLRVVIGPDWEAGAIALELPTHPDVLGSGSRAQAPWVSDAELAGCGALVLWRPDAPIEAQVGAAFGSRATARVLLGTRVPHGADSSIMAGIIAPAGGTCTPATGG